ncbi:YegP family protein [Arthrobacter oryzae]|uniref:YegP family protein n=1 Tax=Arthrobacter oryzae TaxID=409290 RepID=UPI0030C8F17D
MAGMFELFADADTSFRFRLTAPDGTVMALSKPFPDKRAAVAGIAAVREYAGTGFVTEIPAPEPQRSRVSSAARAFGGRAARRKRQVLLRWRQSLRPAAVVADFPAW